MTLSVGDMATELEYVAYGRYEGADYSDFQCYQSYLKTLLEVNHSLWLHQIDTPFKVAVDEEIRRQHAHFNENYRYDVVKEVRETQIIRVKKNERE